MKSAVAPHPVMSVVMGEDVPLLFEPVPQLAQTTYDDAASSSGNATDVDLAVLSAKTNCNMSPGFAPSTLMIVWLLSTSGNCGSSDTVESAATLNVALPFESVSCVLRCVWSAA